MRWLYGALLVLAYLVPLKRWAVTAQRWLLERKEEMADLAVFHSPEDLAAVIARSFVWRADADGRRFKWWDWPSKAGVFQHRLNFPAGHRGTGDCDDVAFWAGALIDEMRGVSAVLLLCVSYRQPRGAHVVLVYKRFGHWYLLNGKRGIKLLSDPNDAVAETVRQMRPLFPEQAPMWYVFETLNFVRVASSPNGRVKK